MSRSFAGALLSAVLVCTGCGDLFDVSDRPPPAPEGFPQPVEYEDAKAELEIDGQRYVTEHAFGLSYNREGGYEDQLRARLELDDLQLRFRHLEEGVVAVGSGDLTATWSYSFDADGTCGEGKLEIMGIDSYDSGVLGDRDYCWGTVQFRLCDVDYDGTVQDTVEVTGRFTSAIRYN